jgi:hypothetical protein
VDRSILLVIRSQRRKRRLQRLGRAADSAGSPDRWFGHPEHTFAHPRHPRPQDDSAPPSRLCLLFELRRLHYVVAACSGKPVAGRARRGSDRDLHPHADSVCNRQPAGRHDDNERHRTRQVLEHESREHTQQSRHKDGDHRGSIDQRGRPLHGARGKHAGL